MDDQRPSFDCTQALRREAHVVVVVRELIRHVPEPLDLIVAVICHWRMSSHSFSVWAAAEAARIRERVWLGEIGRRAHEDHGLDPLRLPRGNMKQRLRAHAHTNRLERADASASSSSTTSDAS